MKRVFGMSICVMLLFAACGQQHDAETLVEGFMKENLIDSSSLSGVEFAKLDSTARLNDSIINILRADSKQSERYRNDIRYADNKQDKSLKILRVKYMLGTEECSDTYYLDKNLTNIIAIKIN